LAAVLNDGLTVGLCYLGQGFEQGKVFIPELMMGARIVQESLEELEPHIVTDSPNTKGTFLIGTVAGDLHDVGKNIVSSVFSASGYQVVDLGIDVPVETFVQKVQEIQPSLLGLSALLTTTMMNQRQVVEALKEAGLRQTVKIIIGGAPASASWAEAISADAYAEDVFSGLAQAERLLN
jgi:5-methyltetrahydrofolate--homocysteine methyltransferase